MGKNERDKNIKKDDHELIEEEYERTEVPHEKPGKRLKEKEKHSRKSDLVLKRGRVLEAYSKNYYRVQTAKEEIICPLSGRLKIVDFSQRGMVVVGDYVYVDYSQHPRIEEIVERENALTRYIERGKNQLEVVIAANIDQVIITTSCKEPLLNLNLVDRYLCAANLANIIPVICINKIDLADDLEAVREQCSYYESKDIRVVYTSAERGEGLDLLKEILHEKDSVFSGASGTGKTSLINRLDPGLKLKTAAVSRSSNKGRHTTSSSSLIPWTFGGYLIDTPGIKTFGLRKSDRSVIPRVFPGFAAWAEECRFSNCNHVTEEDCRVLQALTEKELPRERYQSYLNILASLE